MGTRGKGEGRAGALRPALETASTLENWPIQLHLLSPMAPQFTGRDVLLSADCVAYAAADFHASMLKGKVLAIACPKLDEGKDIYREKITALIDHAQIATLTVADDAGALLPGAPGHRAAGPPGGEAEVPLKAVIVSIDGGKVLSEEWV